MPLTGLEMGIICSLIVNSALHIWEMSDRYRRKKANQSLFVFTQVVLVHELSKSTQSCNTHAFDTSLQSGDKTTDTFVTITLSSSVNLEGLGCC